MIRNDRTNRTLSMSAANASEQAVVWVFAQRSHHATRGLWTPRAMEYAVPLPLAGGGAFRAMGDPFWILDAGEKPSGGGRLPQPEAEGEAVTSSPTGQTKRTDSMSS